MKALSDNYRKFSGKADVLKVYRELAKREYLLDKTLKEIEILVKGQVKPADTIRRSKVGSYFSSSTQQMGNYVEKNNIQLSNRLKKSIARISYKADKVLRENIVLQSISPLDVIKFTNVPVRYSYSTFGRREQRWGYALHKKPFNEEGNSVTVADMPPHFTQTIHNHTLSEYCLIIDTKTEGIFYPGGKKEKIYSTKKSEMLHFATTTPHTLKNPTSKNSRNMTFKQPTGLTDWRPASQLNTVKIIRARLLKGHLSTIKSHQTKKTFTVKDKFYNYVLEIIKLGRGTTYEAKHSYDQYIFVINGKFTISHKDIQKECKKNDFIVIDKNTDYKIVTSTMCRLYTVRN